MTNDLTILVKKADGTFERKKLSELSSAPKPATPAPTKPPVPPAPVASALKREIPKLPAPVKPAPKPIVKPEVKKPVLKKDDFASPLEEKLPPRQDGAPVVPADRTKEADEALKKIKFFIPPDILGRLRALVALYLKDLRGDKEFLEELAAPVKEKGLGLDGRQAGEILRLCQEIKSRVAKETPAAVRPLKGKVDLPMVEEPELPASAAPFNAFKHGSSQFTVHSSQPATTSQKPVIKEEKIFKINSQAGRPDMRDVVARPASVGPIDEIRLFSLIDFRRLSADPREAASRFKQKLINLKEESYLLYLDALNAWRESPLYLEYLGAVNNSLKTGKALSASLFDKNKIQLAEIKAVVEMERSL